MIKSVKVMTVIKTETIIGTGTETDPYRPFVQFWSMDGKCLVTYDQYNPKGETPCE